MNYPTHENMFTVPLFRTRVEPWEKIKTEILKSLDSNYEFDDSGLETDFFQRNKYSGYVYDILRPTISEILKTYFGQLPPKTPPDMWSQKYHNKSEHPVHNHGNGGVSFILYLKFNPDVHKATRFYSPFNDFLTGDLMTFVPKIQEGDLIAFPSFLLHTSQYQTSDEERMIISFNIFEFG